MTVLLLEGDSARLRGYLRRWLLEVKANVFVGAVPARVRERLWSEVTRQLAGGSAVLLYGARNEQGFDCLCFGEPDREIIDLEGLNLVRRAS